MQILVIILVLMLLNILVSVCLAAGVMKSLDLELEKEAFDEFDEYIISRDIVPELKYLTRKERLIFYICTILCCKTFLVLVGTVSFIVVKREKDKQDEEA